jgi:hypothetical protein
MRNPSEEGCGQLTARHRNTDGIISHINSVSDIASPHRINPTEEKANIGGLNVTTYFFLVPIFDSCTKNCIFI